MSGMIYTLPHELAVVHKTGGLLLISAVRETCEEAPSRSLIRCKQSTWPSEESEDCAPGRIVKHLYLPKTTKASVRRLRLPPLCGAGTGEGD